MNTLYKHQQDFLAQNPDKCALVWSCGTGKTRTAIEWAVKSPDLTLIICPKALKANWEREAKKWDKTKNYYVIVTKEEFRRDHLTLPDCSSVIVDEVHNGFLTPQFKSQMSKALKKYLHMHKVPRVLLLSATVYTSSPWNIYNLAYYTGHPLDYMKFKYKFFQDIPMGRRTISQPKKGIESELVALTKMISSVVDIHDCLDVPEQLHLDPEYFALTKSQQKGISEIYDPVPIVRYTYQHEVENGVLLGNEFADPKYYDCDKNDRIIELCKENKKVAIVCRYNIQIDRLHLLLQTELKGKQIYNIRGDVTNRDEICLAVEQSDECVVIIQADCGVGFQLPSFELCIFASMSYAYTSFEQMCGRFLRMDKPSRTTFVYLLTEGDSMDQAVYDAVKRREDFQIQLYDKQK